MYYDLGSTEGENNIIYMHTDNYLSLKNCAQKKKDKGFKSIEIDLSDYQGELYRPAYNTIRKVSRELYIGMVTSGIWDKYDQELFRY